jgi:type VI secretion system secreted protein VgrG
MHDSLRWPHPASQPALTETFVVEKFSGREAVSELFCSDIDALGTSASIDLDGLIGAELTLGLLQADGTRRTWHGICTAASWLGADGGLARYRLRLEPALALLGLRRDSYIFQDKNAREIVSELLADYPQVQAAFEISQQLDRHAILTQYRESDLAFLSRLLANEGLNWRFDHQQGSAEGDSSAQGGHKLVIFDGRVPPFL